jgi:hypothetical protein
MFENEQYITITVYNFYYDMKPFNIGTLLTLRKEPDNIHDDEAIEVLAPLLGKVGYVANSPHTTAEGTMSAEQLYDETPSECAAVVRFMTQTKVIARVLPDKVLSVKIVIRLEDLNDQVYSSDTIDSTTEPECTDSESKWKIQRVRG